MIVWGGRRHGTEVGLQSLLVLPSMLVFSAGDSYLWACPRRGWATSLVPRGAVQVVDFGVILLGFRSQLWYLSWGI